jgi:hypothetical protein
VRIPDVKVSVLLDAAHQQIDPLKFSDALRRHRLQMEMAAGESDAAAAEAGAAGVQPQLPSDPWAGYVPPKGPLVG